MMLLPGRQKTVFHQMENGRSHGLPGLGWPLKCVIHRSLCPHDAQQHVHWQRPGVNLLLIKAWDKLLL